MVPNSLTSAIINITLTSNVGINGVWAFQLNIEPGKLIAIVTQFSTLASTPPHSGARCVCKVIMQQHKLFIATLLILHKFPSPTLFVPELSQLFLSLSHKIPSYLLSISLASESLCPSIMTVHLKIYETFAFSVQPSFMNLRCLSSPLPLAF